MQLDANALRKQLEPLFQENFDKFGELGAAISVWQNGKPILDLHGGYRDARRGQPWNADTLVLIWSATKGLGSACVLHTLQEHKIDIDRRVAEFWPEFAQAGKDEITLAQLLSHQAGLVALDRQVDVQDYEVVIHALEAQAPLWPPGTAHGYHARTFGFLVDELVRRIAKKTLAEYWRETFAESLKLDIWIGLPESENSRVATMYAAKAGKPAEPKKRLSGSDQFYVDLATPNTLARKVFTSPRGLHSVSGMNNPAIRAVSFVSFGGIASANSLAKFYAMLANGGELDGQKFFSEQTLDWMKTTLADGIDRVFQIPIAFSAGFMKDSGGSSAPRSMPKAARKREENNIVLGEHDLPSIFGPSSVAFGHPGAGGSHAFADPENKVSFAYVMNQMEQSLLPNEKSLRLVDAIYL
jgi:CubicO group peptidase (beta-lactamase class C family)